MRVKQDNVFVDTDKIKEYTDKYFNKSSTIARVIL